MTYLRVVILLWLLIVIWFVVLLTLWNLLGVLVFRWTGMLCAFAWRLKCPLLNVLVVCMNVIVYDAFGLLL